MIRKGGVRGKVYVRWLVITKVTVDGSVCTGTIDGMYSLQSGVVITQVGNLD